MNKFKIEYMYYNNLLFHALCMLSSKENIESIILSTKTEFFNYLYALFEKSMYLHTKICSVQLKQISNNKKYSYESLLRKLTEVDTEIKNLLEQMFPIEIANILGYEGAR